MAAVSPDSAATRRWRSRATSSPEVPTRPMSGAQPGALSSAARPACCAASAMAASASAAAGRSTVAGGSAKIGRAHV